MCPACDENFAWIAGLRRELAISKKGAVPILEEDFWQPILEAYAAEPTLAFAMAQTFAMLQRALARGPKGNKEVAQSLENGIRELYQYTHFNQACFRLYRRAVSPKGLATHLDPTMLVDEPP